jgi:preprotein translocase subunit SecY
MRFQSRSGTDDAFVEALREWLADPRTLWIRHLRAMLLLWMIAILLVVLAIAMVARIAVPEAAASEVEGPSADILLRFLFYYSLAAGVELIMAGYLLLFSLRIRHGLRSERLLVKYHDELKDKCPEAQETDEHAIDGRDGSATGFPKSGIFRWLWRGDHSWKAKTDGECVARARRGLKLDKWCALVFMGLVVFFGFLFWTFLSFVNTHAAELSEKKLWAGVAIGLVFGLVGGLIHWCACDHFLEVGLCLRNLRIAPLMLRFHDALAREVQDDS